jgi:glyoxylase-like metal-dependent hydrolase (beta-lactamase superfamily II)
VTAPEAGDAVLAGLGVHRIAVPVPFRDAGGPVNVCAIENAARPGGYTLFDSGVRTEESERTVREGLAAAGVAISEIRQIIVSHGHIDHFGQAQLLSEESGARVLVHPLDRDKIVGDGRWSEQAELYAAYFRKLAIPSALIDQVVEGGHRVRDFARSVEPSRVDLLEGGARLRFARFSVEVLHLPGHTPGLVCLWDEEHRVLFADDHVLARVSPNPLLELHPDGVRTHQSLVTYLASAKKVHALDVDWVVPGHGPPFQGHRALLDGLFEFYGKRQQKLLERLGAAEATAFELFEALFRKLEPERLFLILSEVLGNLEVLEADGRVRRREEGGLFRFALA